MISTIRQAEDNDPEVCYSVLQIGRRLGRNDVKGEFNRKSSKMSLIL